MIWISIAILAVLTILGDPNTDESDFDFGGFE